jgi:ribonuclease E
MPRTHNRVELYEGEIGLFHAFGLEQEIETFSSSRVPLSAGGSLVIEQTEAMVTIDVNSGRMRDADDAETTAVRTNSQAAEEICRQLRLRDLGGVIVIDFIDMNHDRNRRKIENLVKAELKKDRARTKLLRISRLGLLEMTRQRVKPSLESSTFRPCPNCGGTGRCKSEESQALAAMRTIRLAASDDNVARIEMTVPPTVGEYLLNQRRTELFELERDSGTRVIVHADSSLPAGDFRITCADARGSETRWEPPAEPPAQDTRVPTREITREEAAAAVKARQELSDHQVEMAQDEAEDQEAADQEQAGEGESEPKKKKGRRRRRRRRKSSSEKAENQDQQGEEAKGDKKDQAKDDSEAGKDEPKPKPEEKAEKSEEAGEDKPKKRSRRSRSRKKSSSSRKSEDQADDGGGKSAGKAGREAAEHEPAEKESGQEAKADTAGESQPEAKSDAASDKGAESDSEEPAKPKRKRRSRRPRKKKTQDGEEDADAAKVEGEKAADGDASESDSARRTEAPGEPGGSEDAQS